MTEFGVERSGARKMLRVKACIASARGPKGIEVPKRTRGEEVERKNDGTEEASPGRGGICAPRAFVPRGTEEKRERGNRNAEVSGRRSGIRGQRSRARGRESIPNA